MKRNIKKKSTAVVAIIAVAAILLSGTFAYVLNNQHRSDYLSAEDRIYDLTLINNFTQYGEQDWNNNKTVLNPVQIKSSANTADETYVNAYVAVQLMEYLDVYTRGDWLTVGEVLASSLVGTVGTSFNANNTDQALFAIDDNGDYMTYAAATAQFGADYIVEYNGFAMFNGSQTLVQGTAIYGIHGKPMRDEKTEYTYGNPTPYEHVQANGAENQVNAECDATVIEGWGVETPAVEAREYVSLLLDETNAVMLLSDWQAAYAADDTDPALTGAFWIIDDVNGTGWAYWAQALAPGAETSNLLESITLEKEISKIDYYIHVDMASASLDEIDVLAGDKANQGCLMPADLVQMFKDMPIVDSFSITASGDFSGTIINGGTVDIYKKSSEQIITFTAQISGNNTVDQADWTLISGEAWGDASAAGSQTYTVTIPADELGTMVIEAAASDDPTVLIRFTVNVTEHADTLTSIPVGFTEIKRTEIAGEEYALLITSDILTTSATFSENQTTIDNWFETSCPALIKAASVVPTIQTLLPPAFPDRTNYGVSAPTAALAGTETENIAFSLSASEVFEWRDYWESVTPSELSESSSDWWTRSNSPNGPIRTLANGAMAASLVPESTNALPIRPALWVKVDYPGPMDVVVPLTSIPAGFVEVKRTTLDGKDYALIMTDDVLSENSLSQNAVFASLQSWYLSVDSVIKRAAIKPTLSDVSCSGQNPNETNYGVSLPSTTAAGNRRSNIAFILSASDVYSITPSPLLSNSSEWWTRSGGSLGMTYTIYVKTDGSMIHTIEPLQKGIRPALWIEIND